MDDSSTVRGIMKGSVSMCQPKKKSLLGKTALGWIENPQQETGGFYNSILPGFYKSFWPVSPSETAFKAAFTLERKSEWQETKTLKQYN